MSNLAEALRQAREIIAADDERKRRQAASGVTPFPLNFQPLRDIVSALDATVSTMDELVMLPAGAVLRGPDWHGEVYVKVGDVEFAAAGSETPYRASEVHARGPYRVLYEPTD